VTSGGPDAAAVAIALSMFAIFAYHTLGFAVLVWGPEPLPYWLRVPLVPRPPASGALRIASITWVGFMIAVSLLVTAWALMGRGIEPSMGNRVVLLAEVLLLVGWTLFLWTLFRRPRS
jgi:hypothetical protein